MRKNDKNINEVLQRFVGESKKLSSGIAGVKIRAIYEEVMGPVVAGYTEEVKLKKDTLIIAVRSAPLRSELTAFREKLKLRINEALGSNVVDKVIIR